MAATCSDESQEHLEPRGGGRLTLNGPGLSARRSCGLLQNLPWVYGQSGHLVLNHTECERGGGQREKGVSVSFGVRRAKLQFLLVTYWSGSTQVPAQGFASGKWQFQELFEKASVSCLLAVRANPPAFLPSVLLKNAGPVWTSG